LTSDFYMDKIIKVSKKALIITDGMEPVQKTAKEISAMMKECNVKICSADKFSGAELLPADYFIIGCENPKPDSFSYLEEMLCHINLASRRCGLYSNKEKTLNYLLKIVKDCEADVYEPLFLKDEIINKTKIKKWLNGFIAE